MSPKKGTSIYLDRILSYNAKNPEALRIVTQNLVQNEGIASIPGYAHIPRFLAGIRRAFCEKVPVRSPQKRIGMFLDSLTALVVYYLGASSCQAEILGMDPESPAYRKWVKEALLFIFPSLLKELLSDGNDRETA
jgi:hypothetical protein